MTDSIELLPCPFCGGHAEFEEVGSGHGAEQIAWSVGCASTDADCIAYQVIASFSRKCEAAEAWNVRVKTDDKLTSALRNARTALIKCGFVSKGPHGTGDPEINEIDAVLGSHGQSPDGV